MTTYSTGRPVRRVAAPRPPVPAYLPPQPPGDDGIDLKGLIDILRRRWLTVLAVAAAIVALGVLYIMTTPKLYTASTLLLLDPRDQRVLQTEVVPTGSGSDATLVESQLRVITSDAVLGRVVTMLGLAAVPEFGGASDDQAERTNSALDTLASRIAVSRSDRTYVVEIRATSRDPDLSRQIADAMGQAYMADQLESAQATTRQAKEALAGRLNELREELKRAEDKVQAYRAKHRLIGTEGTAVTAQQIAELNQRLVAARAKLAEAQALYEQVRRASAASSSDSLGSQVIAALRTQEAEVARREADISATLGDRHPQVVKVRAELATIRAQIAAEIGRIAQGARNDAEIAAREVASLEAELDRVSGRDIADAGALITLRELQREADAIREVYEAVLARVKETSEQERLETSSARVLAPAATPTGAAFPPKPFILAVAIAFGLGLGAAAALVRERFDDRIRTAAQLCRSGIHVLATVPPFEQTRGGKINGYDYAMRLLRAELRDSPERSVERALLVVAPRKADNAAAIALNLALAAVAGGERVLLIDADATHRTLSRLVAPRAKFGLAEVLQGLVPLKRAVVGGAEGLHVLPLMARRAGYRGRPSRAALEKLVEHAKPLFSYVIFVGAPLSDEPDARTVAEAVDQVALVVRSGVTTREDLSSALRTLAVRDDKTCGVVLTLAIE